MCAPTYDGVSKELVVRPQTLRPQLKRDPLGGSARMRSLLPIVILVLAAGCDPGWTYHERAPRTSTNTTVRTPAELDTFSLRLREAWLFAGAFHLRATVVNTSGQPRPLDSASLQVLDGQGNPLKPVTVGGCAIGYPTARLSSCSPEGYFSVRSTTGFYRRNPVLQELTVRVEGVTRAGRHVALTLPLEWGDWDRARP